MRYTRTEIEGPVIIDLERHADERGWFARAWAVEEMAAEGLETRLVHCNLAYNARRGTVRGMHWQDPPHAEVKLVRATRGAVYDVIVDLRPGSADARRWLGVELSAANGRMLYVPKGFAHGYQTLEDDTETYYLMSEFYAPEARPGRPLRRPGVRHRVARGRGRADRLGAGPHVAGLARLTPGRGAVDPPLGEVRGLCDRMGAGGRCAARFGGIRCPRARGGPIDARRPCPESHRRHA